MNKLFSKKIENIHNKLMECHRDTQGYSPSITGTEREIINRELFQRILPLHYRTGAGTIADYKGRETGQIDAVIELPFSLSFPISSGDNRLYLADCIGAAFEIKSDLNVQWDDAMAKVAEIKKLNRHRIEKGEFASGDTLKIPTYVIAFKGQKSVDTVINKIGNPLDISSPDGILIIEDGIFYGRAPGCNSVYECHDPKHAILAFIACIYKVLKRYSTNVIDLDNYQHLLDEV